MGSGQILKFEIKFEIKKGVGKRGKEALRGTGFSEKHWNVGNWNFA